METKKPISTLRSGRDEHPGTREESVNKTVLKRHHAGFGDTSGENQVPDAGGPVLINQRDKKR